MFVTNLQGFREKILCVHITSLEIITYQIISAVLARQLQCACSRFYCRKTVFDCIVYMQAEKPLYRLPEFHAPTKLHVALKTNPPTKKDATQKRCGAHFAEHIYIHRTPFFLCGMADLLLGKSGGWWNASKKFILSNFSEQDHFCINFACFRRKADFK